MNTKNSKNEKNQRQRNRQKQGAKKQVRKAPDHHEQELIETRMTR